MLTIHPIEALHRIPGRMRFRLHILYRDPKRSESVKACLLSLNGIGNAAVNPITGTLLVIYDQGIYSEEEILRLIEDLTENSWDQRTFAEKYRKNAALRHYTWPMMDVHRLSSVLETNMERGLSGQQVSQRQKRWGLNTIEKGKSISLPGMFLGQFRNFLMQLLLGASAVSFLIGEFTDAVTIVTIVLIEASLGILQEYKAERSLSALKKLSSPQARVIRQGQEISISAHQLVPGDIVLLQSGNLVPADGRILEANYLEVIESPLTGESSPVLKSNRLLSLQDIQNNNMENMIFMGTSIIRGNGKMMVVSTGMHTEMGKIAQMLKDVEGSKTPLQLQLDRMAIFITEICLGCCILISGIGLVTGRPFFEMFRLGVALAVGAIPESLSTIATISMAVSIQRMVKQNAIVRKLPAIETLAHTMVICSDKTGTLTANEMTVKEIYVDRSHWKVTGEGYKPEGCFIPAEGAPASENREALELLLTAGSLCSNASLAEISGEWISNGDPTEIALLTAAEKYGISGIHLKNQYEKLREIPFEAHRMRMTTICRDEQGKIHAFMKGAPEAVLPLCSHRQGLDGPVEMDEFTARHFIKKNTEMTHQALRVLAVAHKNLSSEEIDLPPELLENDFILCGLAGMMDPPRPFVREAIEKCNASGVKVVMITGDHPNTAGAIAKDLDILKDGKIITGSMLEEMSEDYLLDMIDQISVFTRTAPHQKLRIVKAFKDKGYIVAMTGDGINDAPAVKEAHIGIAMGKNGTDVTREASCITLADDNFSTIVMAMEEGKTVNQNIRKFIQYVLSGNLGEVLLIFMTAMTTLPMPLIPSQILFINLATEGLPALALGIDSPSKSIMKRPGTSDSANVFDRRVQNAITSRGIHIGLSSFGLFSGTYLYTRNIARAQTLAFSNLVISQLFHAFDCHREKQEAPGENPYLIPSIALSGLMLMAVLYIPGLQRVFHTTAPSFWDWILLMLTSGVGSRMDRLLPKEINELPVEH